MEATAFQPYLIYSLICSAFFVWVSSPLFIWSFAWMAFFRADLGLKYCHLFVIPHSFSPCVTQKEEQ